MIPFVLVFVFSISFISCDESDATDTMKKDYVEVSPNELYFESGVATDTLNIKSSGEWMISNIPAWLTVSPTNGVDGDELIVSVMKNTALDGRNALLLLQCGDALDTLSVIQYGCIETDYVELNLDGKGVSYSYNAATGNIDITYSNGSLPSVDYGQAFVLPAEYGYDIRVIESSSVSGNTLKMQTTEGNMSNLFRNIGFYALY